MLESNDVDVWRVSLRQLPDVRSALRSTLSPDENQRADRFVFDEHRHRFVAGRGALRSIVARYVGLTPQDVAFEYSPYGKPSLSPRCNGSQIRFNLSHSADLALCVVTLNREVGIDVESIREVVDADQMAVRYFDELESASYQALPRYQKLEGFFVRWTLKEAYIKARGEGLSIPLDRFTIPSTPDASGRHRVHSMDPDDDARWFAMRLFPAPGYAAAMVVEGHDWLLSMKDWQYP